jgi:hypothetical protein
MASAARELQARFESHPEPTLGPDAMGHTPTHGPSSPFRRGADDGVKIAAQIPYYKGAHLWELHQDTTKLVGAAARAVDVPQVHLHAIHPDPVRLQRVLDAADDMLTQSLGQRETARLDLDPHH